MSHSIVYTLDLWPVAAGDFPGAATAHPAAFGISTGYPVSPGPGPGPGPVSHHPGPGFIPREPEAGS